MTRTLNDLAKECYQISKDHGFHDPPKSVPEDLMLMVSELAEALEDHRAHHAPNLMWYEIPKNFYSAGKRSETFQFKVTDQDETRDAFAKPCGIPSEMADVLIRVLDFCGAHGIDIERAVTEKMAFNKTRPFRHGNKAL